MLPITNFQIRPASAASFWGRGLRLFSFQKSLAGGELDDSHVTPKSSLNILRYGIDSRGSAPFPERDRHQGNFCGAAPGRHQHRENFCGAAPGHNLGFASHKPVNKFFTIS